MIELWIRDQRVCGSDAATKCMHVEVPLDKTLNPKRFFRTVKPVQQKQEFILP